MGEALLYGVLIILTGAAIEAAMWAIYRRRVLARSRKRDRR